jgi:hypothetical protein
MFFIFKSFKSCSYLANSLLILALSLTFLQALSFLFKSKIIPVYTFIARRCSIHKYMTVLIFPKIHPKAIVAHGEDAAQIFFHTSFGIKLEAATSAVVTSVSVLLSNF